MKRPLRVFLFLGLAVLAVWYFAVKQHHYQISFTTKQPAAIVYNQILEWQGDNKKGITEVVVDKEDQYSEIVQFVHVGDSLFKYAWHFSKKNDELTQVKVRITDEINGLSQKIRVPFSNNAFVKRSIKTVKDIGDEIVAETAKFKVHSITETVFPGSYCVYLPMESPVKRKASLMLYSISDLMGYINENEIPLQGDPYLEITDWDQERSIIKYNFCFPIQKSDSLPATDKVLFKESPSFKGIRAEYNGNYAISNNAWYYLLEYAERHNLKVKNLPVEVFLNDPHSGGDAMNWKAHIYLPLRP